MPLERYLTNVCNKLCLKKLRELLRARAQGARESRANYASANFRSRAPGFWWTICIFTRGIRSAENKILKWRESGFLGYYFLGPGPSSQKTICIHFRILIFSASCSSCENMLSLLKSGSSMYFWGRGVHWELFRWISSYFPCVIKSTKRILHKRK